MIFWRSFSPNWQGAIPGNVTTEKDPGIQFFHWHFLKKLFNLTDCNTYYLPSQSKLVKSDLSNFLRSYISTLRWSVGLMVSWSSKSIVSCTCNNVHVSWEFMWLDLRKTCLTSAQNHLQIETKFDGYLKYFEKSFSFYSCVAHTT